MRYCLAMFFVVLALAASASEAPEWVEQVRAAAATDLHPDALPLDPLPAIDVEASYDPITGDVHGVMQIWIDNDGPQARNDIGFALHANDSGSYGRTSITIKEASVNGQPVEPRLVDEGRGLVLPLAEALPPGEWISCRIAFHTFVPIGGGRGGLLSRNGASHTLYSWLPEPAVLRDGDWRFPSLPMSIDPSHVRMADYRCRINLAHAIFLDMALLASGQEERLENPGQWLIGGARIRNFALWLSSKSIDIMTLEDDRHRVRVAFEGHKTIDAAFCASVARDALAIASDTFGPYPRDSFDIVFTTLAPGIGGMEASGITFISREAFDRLNRLARDPLATSGALHAVIHEVMHSWWYDQVGNDTAMEGWLDEPLAEWSTLYVMERMRDRPFMAQQALLHLPAISTIANTDPAPLSHPSHQLNAIQYGLLLYARGPLLYEALRHHLGDEAFFEALRRYYTTHHGDIATRSDWEAALLDGLAEPERQEFLATWIDGLDDPLPAILTEVFPAWADEITRNSTAAPGSAPDAIPEKRDQAPQEAPAVTTP